MKLTTAIAICAALTGLATITLDTPVEAKKFKPHISHKAGKNIFRGATKNMARAASRDVRHAARAGRWINGVWVGTGIAGGVAAVTRNCNYYYRRFQETGDPKWRNKYRACVD